MRALNFKRMMGLIGITLIACNILALVDLTGAVIGLSYGLVFRIIFFSNQLFVYELLCASTIVGLVLYILGRKGFWGCVKGNKAALVLLKILSLVLMLLSFYYGGLTNAARQYYDTKVQGYPLTLEESVFYLMVIIWCLLGFISGLVWFIDGFTGVITLSKTGLPPLKQKIDLQSQTKYPKNLFAKYVKLYPHNPIGVLEWHIDKGMKKGKTREQALEELINVR